MSDIVFVLAAAALAAWIYLLIGRDDFWRANQRLEPRADPPKWPAVVAVVPARDEADVVGRATASLLGQDYPGAFEVVLVDDYSADGTADEARRAAAEAGAEARLHVFPAPVLAPGWTGKMGAVAEGVRRAGEIAPGARYLLLTDADIAHHGSNLRRLVAKAEDEALDLVSLMVKLHCDSFSERLLIPAFVFFFQKLYPFPAVNNPRNPTAGAAGGCMLVRRDALARAGGIEAIGGELIDDCALARNIKRHGPIWLGLATDTVSLRPYRGIGDIWNIVARTAYTQLGHSPARLAAALAGMLAIYLAPVLALAWGLAAGDANIATMGAVGLGLMWGAYYPTWAIYGPLSPAFFALPLAAALFTLMTLDSARRHYRGKGGGWKDRSYPGAARPS